MTESYREAATAAEAVHPALQQVVEMLDEMPGPELYELPPAEAREAYEQMIVGGDPVEAVESVEDRTIDGPGGDLDVRVYDPGVDDAPTLVYYHGGGFVIGSPDTVDDLCRVLANEAGAVVVSVDYRLAPEDPFPAAVEDATAAAAWAEAHVDELGGDPDAIAVGGDSAGGTLAAVVALRGRDGDGLDVDYQLLFYPSVAFREEFPSLTENAEGNVLTAEDMEYFGEHYLENELHGRNPYAFPLQARSHADLPPATVVTAGFDPLRDEGAAYADALEAEGVDVSFRHFPDAIHGFATMFQPVEIPLAREAAEAAAADLTEDLS